MLMAISFLMVLRSPDPLKECKVGNSGVFSAIKLLIVFAGMPAKVGYTDMSEALL